MIEFYCPHCDKLLKTSPNRAGLEAKCPGCGEQIVVPETTPDEQHIDRSHDEFAGSDDQPDARCPVCGEGILPHQSRCSLCGAAFERDQQHPERLSRRRESRPFPAGETISEAFTLWSSNWLLLTFATLTKAILIGLPSILLFAGIVAAEAMLKGNQFEELAQTVLLVAMLFQTLFTLSLTAYLHAGSLVLNLKLVRGQRASIGDLFAGGPYWIRMQICGFLMYLMVIIGFTACIIPCLIVQAIFLPYGYVLVGENRASIDCLLRSKALTDGNWGSLLLLVILGILFYYAGMASCYIGLILAVPLVDLMYAVAYERMLHQTPIDQIHPEE